MSLPSARPIAFNRRLSAAWLKEGVRLLAEGMEDVAWLERMEGMVRAEHHGRDTIQKSMRYLRHIWIEPGPNAFLRPEAISLFSTSRGRNRDKIIGWGMAIATYPFLNEVAATIGRILRAQPEMKVEQLLRKLCESYGEKETVRRSARYSLGLIVEMGFLKKTGSPGCYASSSPLRTTDRALAAWLLGAWFFASGKAGPVDRVALNKHPSLFFLDTKSVVDHAISEGRLATERLSFSQEMVCPVTSDL